MYGLIAFQQPLSIHHLISVPLWIECYQHLNKIRRTCLLGTVKLYFNHICFYFHHFTSFVALKAKVNSFQIANQPQNCCRKSQQKESSTIFLHLSSGTRSTLLIRLSPVLIRSKNSSPPLTTQLAPLRLMPLHKTADNCVVKFILKHKV